MIADDHAQNAEVRRVGQGKGADVDARLGQGVGDFSQTAGPVFQKNG